ncbi:hypothetical protein NAT51_10140 [Flavobacterium amniphilum]|uniref:hypothetical protein n=1 Tax=Flavobacterium amniphilum TaxID=1834035 RepID=UPI00202A5367|nr:hypothetical protein [Flavobacterium amniphilum]MCL9805883.1 hypothetical protein [Flavobacterium amniphilum]
MIPKKITLGLKYSINIDETNHFFKQIHTDLLAYLIDAPNKHQNIYNGVTTLNYRKILNIGIKQIIDSYIQASIQFLGFPLPAVIPIDLDTSYRKQIKFNNYAIIDFEYNIDTQTLIIHTLLQIEDFYLVGNYSNKLIIVDLTDIDNYNNDNQVLSYTIEDNDNLVILRLN